MLPGEISMLVGPLLTVKLKSGCANGGGVLVVFELTELDAVEDVAAALEDAAVLNDVEALDAAVVLDEEALLPDLG